MNFVVELETVDRKMTTAPRRHVAKYSPCSGGVQNAMMERQSAPAGATNRCCGHAWFPRPVRPSPLADEELERRPVELFGVFVQVGMGEVLEDDESRRVSRGCL
jgi:hypothetical protein